jgi:hypothetical protein
MEIGLDDLKVNETGQLEVSSIEQWRQGRNRRRFLNWEILLLMNQERMISLLTW